MVEGFSQAAARSLDNMTRSLDEAVKAGNWEEYKNQLTSFVGNLAEALADPQTAVNGMVMEAEGERVMAQAAAG